MHFLSDQMMLNLQWYHRENSKSLHTTNWSRVFLIYNDFKGNSTTLFHSTLTQTLPHVLFALENFKSLIRDDPDNIIMVIITHLRDLCTALTYSTHYNTTSSQCMKCDWLQWGEERQNKTERETVKCYRQHKQQTCLGF